jgi:hypothetical protein
MRAVLAFAFRRASARVVFAVGVGSVVLIVFRAVRPVTISLETGGFGMVYRNVLGSSTWDLVAAALLAVIGALAAAAIYRQHSISD